MHTWLVTGCSSGFGKEIVLSALARGDKVIATCRGSASTRLADLVKAGATALELDIAAPAPEIEKFVQGLLKEFGTVDFLVNNAGYVQKGAFEENSAEEMLAQFNTNFFGPLNLTRSFLPHFRSRKSGTIGMIGSQGGYMGFVGMSPYIATKYALGGITEVLAREVEHLGIRVICVEPGNFRTEVFKGDNARKPSTTIPDYIPSIGATMTRVDGMDTQDGDPHKAAEHIVDLLRGEGFAKGKTDIPKRIALGEDAYDNLMEWTGARIESAKEWREWSVGVDFDK